MYDEITNFSNNILLINSNVSFARELYVRLSTNFIVTVALDITEAKRWMNIQKPDFIICEIKKGDDLNNLVEEFFSAHIQNGAYIFFIAEDLNSIDFEKVYRLGNCECISAKLSSEIIEKRIKDVIQTRNVLKIVPSAMKSQETEAEKAKNAVINALLLITTFCDSDTEGHLQRTRLYTKTLLHLMKDEGYDISDSYIDNIILASSIHDVGKIAIADAVLKKPGRFSENEFEHAKLHVIYGAKIINGIMADKSDDPFFRICRDVVETHHERWDGKGYPKGLEKERIPLAGRVVALVDVYDALRTDRVYKKGFSSDETETMMYEDKGKAFDPALVDIFYRNRHLFKRIAENYKIM